MKVEKERAMALPPQLITLVSIMIFILPLLAFWAWMFTDMRANDRLPGSAKSDWALAFILLNIFGAVLYYLNVYRGRQ
jgi:hypothetical protein